MIPFNHELCRSFIALAKEYEPYVPKVFNYAHSFKWSLRIRAKICNKVHA